MASKLSMLNEALIVAAKNGDLQTVVSVIDMGADIHFNNDDALDSASSSGHLHIVQYLLGRGANIHTDSMDYHNCALSSAAEYGHLHVVKYFVNIISKYIKIGIIPKNHFHPHIDNDFIIDYDYYEFAIRGACKNGHLNIVKFLIDQGGHVNPPDCAGEDFPICVASKNGHLAIVKFLIDNGANIHVGAHYDLDDKDYALEEAISNGHLDVVQLLVNHGVSVNTMCYNGSPLDIAIFDGHLSIVKFLVTNGVHINSKELNRALEYKYIDIFMFLKSSLESQKRKIDDIINNYDSVKRRKIDDRF